VSRGIQAIPLRPFPYRHIVTPCADARPFCRTSDKGLSGRDFLQACIDKYLVTAPPICSSLKAQLQEALVVMVKARKIATGFTCFCFTRSEKAAFAEAQRFFDKKLGGAVIVGMTWKEILAEACGDNDFSLPPKPVPESNKSDSRGGGSVSSDYGTSHAQTKSTSPADGSVLTMQPPTMRSAGSNDNTA
jgi:hypothetical protein